MDINKNYVTAGTGFESHADIQLVRMRIMCSMRGLRRRSYRWRTRGRWRSLRLWKWSNIALRSGDKGLMWWLYKVVV